MSRALDAVAGRLAARRHPRLALALGLGNLVAAVGTLLGLASPLLGAGAAAVGRPVAVVGAMLALLGATGLVSFAVFERRFD